MVKYLILLLFLTGCKASQPTFLTLTAYSPGERSTTYWFGKFPNRLTLVDTLGAYDFSDTIFLIKKPKQ